MNALRIGVTMNRRKDDPSLHWVTPNMVNAVTSAGAEIVGLDYPAREEELLSILPTLDGLILAGGPDVHPRYFGEEIDPHCGLIVEDRDEMELFLTRWAFEHDFPTLGVCRGMQVMNIALGGNIWQDIVHPLGLVHRQTDDMRYFHDVIFEGEGILRGLVSSDRYPVNSYHHQAVKRVADGLTATAHAPDGVIEAIEQKDMRFFLGVQWHPESSYCADSFSKKIFAAFLGACRG